MKVAWIYKDELVEKKLKMGDVVHIDAGSTFYLVNTGKGQRLHIICSIDASDGLGFGPPYQVIIVWDIPKDLPFHPLLMNELMLMRCSPSSSVA